jgi:hypothetical protein
VPSSAAPLQFLILLVASWLSRRHGQAVEFLRVENRVLRARLGCGDEELVSVAFPPPVRATFLVHASCGAPVVMVVETAR